MKLVRVHDLAHLKQCHLCDCGKRERERVCVRERPCEWVCARCREIWWGCLAGWLVGVVIWKSFFFLKVSYALSHLNSTVTFKWDTSDNEKKCLMLLRSKTFMTEVFVFPTRQLHQLLFRSFFEFHVWSQLKKSSRSFYQVDVCQASNPRPRH